MLRTRLTQFCFRTGWCAVLLLALCGCVRAESTLTLSAERLTVGEKLLIEATDAAATRTYTLYRDGELINEGQPTDARHAAMNPQDAGEYTLVVRPEGGKAETVRFTVYDALSAGLNTEYRQVRLGEPLLCTAQVTGGIPPLSFDYSVWQGTERIAHETTAEREFEYIPFTEGDLTVSMTVTDALGHTVPAVADPVTVLGDGGMTVTGNLSPVLVQGGIRELTVLSPGPWSAKTESDAITLLNTCGNSGDQLVFAVGASAAGARSAVISLSSLGLNKRVVIQQSGASTEEAEVYLFTEVSDWVKVDESAALSFLCTTGRTEYTVSVTASGAWQAETDASFVHCAAEGGRLTVRVDENTGSRYRTASVHVRSGSASAVIGIMQPGVPQGASVREVRLNSDRGQAYQDEIEVRVVTDLTANRVSLTIEQNEPITYTQEIATEQEDTLLWRFTVPLTGAGSQSWLFSAMNDAGSDSKALATISVGTEAPAFAGEPEASADRTQIIVNVTQSTKVIRALDQKGELLRTYTVQNSRIDRALDRSGRYAQWTLPVIGELPAALSIGDESRNIRWPEKAESAENAEEAPAFRIYSQEDGTWRSKTYRFSNLEQSGCAIFALSHALHVLGIEGEETEPAQLATTFSFALVEGGTLNSTLIGNAGKAFGYRSRYELYKEKKDILKKYANGAVFSFSIVRGHIAMTDRLSEDRTMCHVIDSAPRATFERIKGETPYRYDEKTGKYVELKSPAELPGVLYYVDTGGFDGAEYWLPLDYVVGRGVRLIQKR